MALINVKPRGWTVDEYARMGEAGIFRPGERVELIEGEIVPVSPQNVPHASRIARLTTLFVRTFGETHEVRVQLPLTLGERSEPEPDFALVTSEDADRSKRHPDRADLVIEIADSSLSFDRNEKASLYAKALIPEYWILNLANGRVEVRRRPGEEPEGSFGWGYREVTLLAAGQEVTPLFCPGARFSVDTLLGL